MSELDEAARRLLHMRATGRVCNQPALQQRLLRRRFPTLGLVDVFRRVSEMQRGVL